MQSILNIALGLKRQPALLFLAVLLLGSIQAKAVPASPNPFHLRQPDGSEITLRVFGDEWFHWYEITDGRPVTLDSASGFWMYSLPSDTGPNVSSGKRAGVDAPTTPPWQPRPSAAKQAAIRNARIRAHANYVNSSGTGLVPVILGNFSDTTPAVTAATLKTMLFSTATGSNSMANFYKEVSYGKFTVSPGASGVQDWVTVSHPTTYYSTNKVASSQNANDGPQADLFVQDAVLGAVAAGYDFSPYAQGGKVPVVCVVHAGYGEESGGGPGTIWSHRGTLSGSLGAANGPVTVQTANGPVVIDAYIVEPETQPKPSPAKGSDVVGIGVFCHEYGHALGLPDLYDTTYASLGIGSWSVMAYGSYNQINRAGDCPAHFDPWCKAKLGWINPIDYTLNYQNVQFPAAATTPFAAKLWKDGQAGQQYFLVENRYATGFDTGLPTSGLLIWHIDESKGGDISVFNRDNTQTWYPVSFPGAPADTNSGNFHVELMQADNLWQLNVTNKTLQSVGDAGDPFPGSTGNRVFGPNTGPNSQAYNVGATPGYNSFVTVSNISDAGRIMTADLYTRSPNSGPLADWVNIAGVVPPYSGAQFSALDAQNPVVIRAFPGVSGATLSQAQLYINRSSDGLWWDFTNQKWGTNIVSSNYNMASSEQRGLTLAFVDSLPGGTNLLNGTYVFTVRVIDSAAVPTQLVLAMTAVHAPKVYLSLPDNSVVNTLTNTITAVATEDTGLGIQSVQFALYWDSAASEGGAPTRWYWTGNTWSTTPAWLGSTFPSHPPQATETISIGPDARDLLTEKQYTFEARAVDGFGDAVTNIVSVFYDPGAPGTIYWQYPSSGDWFNAGNWNLGRVPLATDCVVVNQPGDYTVSINGSVSVNSLRFGRVVGINQQRLALVSGSLSIGGSDTNKIYANSKFDMGGNLTMGVMQLSPEAAWNWTNGAIIGTVNIPANATLTANQPGGILSAFGPINNSGTLALAGGDVQLVGPAAGYSGELINLPGGLVDFQGDSSLATYSGELFINQGLVRKSGGTGVSQIKPVFLNSGVSDAETGTISLMGGGTLTSAQMTGAGTSLFTSGTYALVGTVNASNAVLGGSGASLTGTNAVLGGVWTWTNGAIAGGSTLTLQTNSVLTLAGIAGADYGLYGELTNAGTIRLVSGNLDIIGAAAGYSGELINLPGGLVDIQADVSIDDYSGELFVNQGVVRKSGGSGVSVIKPVFDNTGSLDVRTGTLTLAGGGSGSGQFLTEAGATMTVSGGYEMDNASVIGTGTNVLTGGTFYVDGSLNTAQVVLAGGALGGTNGVIRTAVTWTSGSIAPGSTLTVATNAILTLAGAPGTDYGVYGVLTNTGTIRLASGNLQIIGAAAGYSGEFINLPGALVDFQSDSSIHTYSGELFINQGTVRKSGGTGVSLIQPVFLSSGVSDAETGTISLVGTGTLMGAEFTGAGTSLFSSGTYVLVGTINASNAVLGGGGASLTGTNAVLGGVWTWTNGAIAGGSTLTLQTNSVLTLAGIAGTDYGLYGELTNAGTIRLVSGNLDIIGAAAGYSGELINLPGGLVELQSDVSIDDYSGELFINQGVVRKSGGSGVSVIKPVFDNTGSLDVRTGTLTLAGGGSGSGQFVTEGGTTMIVSGGYEMDNASVTGAGTNILTGGTFYLDGSLNTAQVILAGGSLGGTNGVIRTAVTWTSGSIAPGSTLTVASNATLTLAGATNTNYGVYGVLTNAGTIRLAGGDLELIGAAAGYSGEFINLPGALVDFQSDSSIHTYSGELFINQGTVRKSAGTGVSQIQPVFLSSGVSDAETGTISLVGTGTLTGAQFTGAGTSLFSSGTYVLVGTINASNAVLGGGGATLTGTNAYLGGTWTWTNGSLANLSTLTLQTNSVLTLAGVAGTDYGLYGELTNAGTIRLASGNLEIIGAAAGYSGEFINLPGALVDFQSDSSIHTYSGEQFINQGVVRKSAGKGVSQIQPVFDNSGTLDVQTGVVGLGAGFDLEGGVLNFGINSLTNYGQVSFSGAAALAGTVSANLNNGFSPALGNSFQVVTYSSMSGAFDGFNLPGGITWQTNYGADGFTLAVLNAAGIVLSSPPQSQSVQAGQTVTFTATASGTSPVAYQWFFDGTNIAGAAGSSLILTNAQPAQSGIYYVVVSNASGAITSSNAVLTVTGSFTAPQLIDLKYAGQTLSVSVMSQAGAVYAFEYKNALTDAAWTAVQTAPGTGGLIPFVDPGPLPKMRFYRIRIQ